MRGTLIALALVACGPKTPAVEEAAPAERGAPGLSGPVGAWLKAHDFSTVAPVPADEMVVIGQREAKLGETVLLEVQLQREGGDLKEALLRTWTDGPDGGALRDLAVKLCGPLGPVDSFTPSPLGTPTPGEEWDPVILTKTRCHGTEHGAQVHVSHEARSASDFENAELMITVKAPAS